MNLTCHKNACGCAVCVRSRTSKWAAGVPLATSTMCPSSCGAHCSGGMTSSLQVSVGFVDSWAGMGVALGGTAGQDEGQGVGGKGLKLEGGVAGRQAFPCSDGHRRLCRPSQDKAQRHRVPFGFWQRSCHFFQRWNKAEKNAEIVL